MRRKLILFLTTLMLLVMVVPVLATPNTKVDFIQDVAPGGTTSDADMLGPTGFGFVNFNQDASGNLRITVVLKNAEPNISYTIYLVAGPTHATVEGYISIGTFMTNVVGNGATTIIVSVVTLQTAPFGSGARTDHLDVLGVGYPANAGGYVIGGLDYSVP